MLLIHKTRGEDGTTLANIYKQNLGKKKVVVCGKLDPMASGELLLLFDEECKQMNLYLEKEKIYEWFIIWGISTDTTDTLGLITENKNIEFDENVVKEELKNFEGKHKQKFHKYSAINVTNKNGLRQPLWKWSKEKRLDEIELPEKEVNVFNTELLYTEKINFSDIKKQILYDLNKVNGDFRQLEIKKQWLKFEKKNLYISKFSAYVSTGFYIRQLVEDIGKKTGYLGIALNINRLEIII